MDINSLSYKTLKNSSYLFVGFLVPMVFTIFVTRELSVKLGIVEFGVFLLLNAINSFVGYIDLGLGAAVTKFAAEYHARGDVLALKRLLSSSQVMFLITGSVGMAVFFILGKWFLPAFNIPSQSYNNIFFVFILAGAMFFFNSMNSTHSSVLASLQRFDLITKLGTANLIAVSLGTIILLKMGFQLKAVMALNLASVLLQSAAFWYYAKKLLPNLPSGFVLEKAEVAKAYKFGLQTFVSSISDSSLVFLDRLIIPVFLSPSQLAFYSVPGNVALKISGVTNNLAGMFFPMASALSGTGQMEKLKHIYIRAFRNLSVVSLALSVSIILFSEKILFFWLGQDYAQNGTAVLRVLAVTYYIVALYVPLRSLLLGLGQMKLLIRQSLVMAIINLLLLLILVPKFGIVGAAWAYLFSVLPMLYTFYSVERNLFGMNNQWEYYPKLYAKLVMAGIIDALIIYFALLPLVTNVWALIIIGPVSVLLCPAIYYILGFMEKEDTALFGEYFFAVKNRLLGRRA